jgi:hypothetical protein
MRLVKLLALTLILTCSIAFAGPVTIVNPGFETGGFTGWTQWGNTGFTGIAEDGVAAHSGTYYAYFGPMGSVGGITQNLATTPGAAYDLRFWLRTDGYVPSEVQVLWDGNPVYDVFNPPASPWTQITILGAVASSASTPLAFGFRNDPGFVHLDDISVSDGTTIPEPSTFLMLGAGALLIGLRRMRLV